MDCKNEYILTTRDILEGYHVHVDREHIIQSLVWILCPDDIADFSFSVESNKHVKEWRKYNQKQNNQIHRM